MSRLWRVRLTAAVVGPLLAATAAPAALADDPARPPAATPAGPGTARDLTIELRDAFLARQVLDPRLGDDDAGVRARPTEPNDPGGTPWDPSAPRASSCTAQLCVHYVTTTADAPPLTATDGVTPDWVRRTLEVGQHALDTMAAMGYPAPASDNGAGGTPQFDVYLAEIGTQGLYGYCAPEESVPGHRHQASAYCVFDDDFAGFPMGPDASLRVTAAHELFHAVQFGIDATEDPWFLEATATWMEEQVADDVDDNRQFLKSGQLGRRGVPLDRWSGDLAPYGNWIFFQHLSEAFGVDAVRRAWELAADPDRFSVHAVRKLVQREDGRFPDFYARFAAANLTPARSYDEGAAYARQQADTSVRLGPQRQAWRDERIVVPHLASHVVKVATRRSVRGKAGLRLTIDAGARRTGHAVRLVVQRKDGGVGRRTVRLDRQGRGQVRVDLSRRKVRRVLVVLASGSTRYDCKDRTDQFACQGTPLDDDVSFALAARLVRNR